MPHPVLPLIRAVAGLWQTGYMQALWGTEEVTQTVRGCGAAGMSSHSAESEEELARGDGGRKATWGTSQSCQMSGLSPRGGGGDGLESEVGLRLAS